MSVTLSARGKNEVKLGVVAECARRVKRGESVASIAETVGRDVGTVAAWLRGDGLPTFRNAVEACHLLGLNDETGRPVPS